MDFNAFFANLFELWGLVFHPISNDLYSFGIFTTVGFVMLALALLTVIAYYYIINSVRFCRFRHWLMMFLGSSIVTTIFSWIYAFNTFNYNGVTYAFGDYMTFILVVLVWSMFFFFLFSMILKWGSRNAKRSPF